MDRRSFLATVLAGITGAPAATAHAAAASYRDPMDYFLQPFLGDLRDALADARSSGRKGVVIMYHFEECPYCRRMKKEVLSRPDVQDWYRREFVVIGVDTRGAQAITGVDGRTLPESEFARAVGIRATPTFDFLAPDGKPMYRRIGALYDPAQFLLLGRYVASGAYRTSTFAQYARSRPKKGK